MTTIRLEIDIVRLMHEYNAHSADVVANLDGVLFSVIGLTFIVGDTWLLLSGTEMPSIPITKFLHELKQSPVTTVYVRKGGWLYHISGVYYQNCSLLIKATKQ